MRLLCFVTVDKIEDWTIGSMSIVGTFDCLSCTIVLECVYHLSIDVFDPMLKLDALSSSGGNSRFSC